MTVYQPITADQETALRKQAAAGEPVLKNVNGLDVAMTVDEITARKTEVTEAIAAQQAAIDAAANAPKVVSIDDRIAALEAAAKAAKIM